MTRQSKHALPLSNPGRARRTKTALATLSIDLVAKLANLESGFTKAQHLAEKNASQMEDAFNKTRDAGIAIGSAIAAAFSVREIIGFVTASIDAADRMNDLAKTTQLTVEQVGGLGFAASQAGSDLEGAAASMGKLNLAIAKAGAGDKATTDAFDKMGVNIRETNGRLKDGISVLAEVADKFVGYADGPNKAALANAIFGKSYQSMMPLLADGGDALLKNVDFFKQFGGVTTESALAADKFNDTMGEMRAVSQGVRNQIVAELTPALQTVATALKEMQQAGGGMPGVASAVRDAFSSLAVVGAYLATTFVQISRGMDLLVNAAGVIGKANWFDWKGPGEAINKLVGQYTTQFASARHELGAFTKEITSAGKQAAVALDTSFAKTAASWGSSVKPEAPSLASEATKVAHAARATAKKVEILGPDVSQGLKDAMAALDSNDLANAVKTTAAISELNSAFAAGLIPAANFTAALEKLRGKDLVGPIQDPAEVERYKADLAAEAVMVNSVSEAQQRWNDQLRAFMDNTAGAKLEEQLVLMGKLSDEYEKGTFGIVGSTEAMRQFGEVAQLALGNLPGAMKDTTDQMTEFSKQAARNIQDSLGSTLLASFKGNTSNMLSAWGDMIQQMIAQALAAKLAKALFGDMGTTGTAGGILGSIVGAFFGSGKASGGAVDPWSVQPVNERGPELLQTGGRSMLLMGAEGGRVVPNSMLGGSGGSTFNFHIASGVSRNELASMIPALTEHVKASVQMSMRRPGYQRS